VSGKNTLKQVKVQEKEAQAYKLRLYNKTFDEIALALGYAGPSGAYKAYMNYRKRIIILEPQEIRDNLVALLDDVSTEFILQARKGIRGGWSTVNEYVDRKAKLLGLYPAEKHEIMGEGGGPLVTKVIFHVEDDPDED